MSENLSPDKCQTTEQHGVAPKLDLNHSAIPRVIVTPVLKPESSSHTGGTEDPQQHDEANKGLQNEKTSGKKVTIVEDFDTFRKSAIERRSRSRGSSITRMSASAAMKAGMFSCHTHSQDQLREMAKSASSNGESISNYIIDDPFEERRRMLLDIEHSYANNLTERKEVFLDELDLYIAKQNEEKEEVKESEGEKRPESRLERLTRREMRRLQEKAKRESVADCRLRGDHIFLLS